MTTRADVERLRLASSRLVEMAKADMLRLFDGLDLSRPEAARDALLEIVPALVREYGELAAVAAAEWYEEVRAAQVGGAYSARLGSVIAEAAPVSSVKYAAGHLFTDTPDQAMAVLSGALQRHILYSSRGTVARNAEHDPAKPRFARVPSGRKTCAWCELMSSRGFVYFTKRSAGDLGRGVGDDFHDDCDCQIVAEFDRAQHHIEGYDPDAMYGRYQKGREYVDGSDDPELLAYLDTIQGDPNFDAKATAFAMRRLYPDQYKDGVHIH